MIMIEKIKKTIKKHDMLNKGDCVVVAVSGGPDSMALLTVMETLSSEYKLRLIAAHLNHGIRGEETDREELFVKKSIEVMGIEFESKKIHVPFLKKHTGRSIEEIGREERYRFFKEVAAKYCAQKIALGHNLNDQAETVLMNLLRGSGAEGLKGILPVKDNMLIRPLLGIKRGEILDFLKERQISYIMDPSNDSVLYLRNRIRHCLIPELKTLFNVNLEEKLSRMADILRIEDEYMKSVVRGILTGWGITFSDEKIEIKISDLRMHHPAIQNRIIKTLLQKLSAGSKRIGHAHVESIVNLADNQTTGGKLNLPSGINVRREYDLLYFSIQKDVSKYANEKLNGFQYGISIPDKVHIHEIDLNMTFDMIHSNQKITFSEPNTAYMDYEKIIPPLVLRSFRPGDRIQPMGMEGTRKIKSYFIDKKIAHWKRRAIPLLVDEESVIWIAGMSLSERVKITDKSRMILKAEIV